MTSLEMAEATGKPHSDLLKSIRKMETSWAKFSGGNFSLANYTDNQGKPRPMYQFAKTEFLYVISKFNDEIRAKLVLRWEELELASQSAKSIRSIPYRSAAWINVVALGKQTARLLVQEELVYICLPDIAKYLGIQMAESNVIRKAGEDCLRYTSVNGHHTAFISFEGLELFLAHYHSPVGSAALHTLRSVYLQEPHDQDEAFPYCFTEDQMHGVLLELGRRPVNKVSVMNLLLAGKGGQRL